MKINSTTKAPKLHTAYTFSEVKEGVMYRTPTGSIAFKPKLGLGVALGNINSNRLYVRLAHGKAEAQSLTLASAARSTFPWTEVEAGFDITLTQE